MAGPAPAADSAAAGSMYAQGLTGVLKSCLCVLPFLAGNHEAFGAVGSGLFLVLLRCVNFVNASDTSRITVDLSMYAEPVRQLCC